MSNFEKILQQLPLYTIILLIVGISKQYFYHAVFNIDIIHILSTNDILYFFIEDLCRIALIISSPLILLFIAWSLTHVTTYILKFIPNNVTFIKKNEFLRWLVLITEICILYFLFIKPYKANLNTVEFLTSILNRINNYFNYHNNSFLILITIIMYLIVSVITLTLKHKTNQLVIDLNNKILYYLKLAFNYIPIIFIILSLTIIINSYYSGMSIKNGSFNTKFKIITEDSSYNDGRFKYISYLSNYVILYDTTTKGNILIPTSKIKISHTWPDIK